MKWIDYTALTLILSPSFSEKIVGFPDSFMTLSAYLVYIYLPCLAESDVICNHMYSVPSIFML